MTEIKSNGLPLFRENVAFRDLYKCEPEGARNGHVRMGDILVSFSYMETANALEMEKRVYSAAQCWQFLHSPLREAYIVSSKR